MEPGKRAALLVSEVQNGIVNPAYRDNALVDQVVARGIVPRINTMTAAFRGAGLPVVFNTIAAARADWDGFVVNCPLFGAMRRDGRLVTGTKHAAVHDDLVVMPDDLISHRSHGAAPFTGTDLDATLRGHRVNTVVLVGVSTNIALPGAATEAVGLGYEVVLVEDCTAGATPESHEIQVSVNLSRLATIADSASVIAALGERTRAN